MFMLNYLIFKPYSEFDPIYDKATLKTLLIRVLGGILGVIFWILSIKALPLTIA